MGFYCQGKARILDLTRLRDESSRLSVTHRRRQPNVSHTATGTPSQRPGTSVGMAKGIGITSSNLNFILILMEGMRNEEGGTGREQTSQMVIKCSC